MAKNLTNYVKSIGSVVGGGSQNLVEILAPYTCMGSASSCGYAREFTIWCVPPGMSSATFHLWGGGGTVGGMAAGAIPCGVSPPSGSGAYAKKTISVTPGDCYVVHVGGNFCISTCTNPTTLRTATGYPETGKHTYVTGTGLTNFCAEGGSDSCTCTLTNIAGYFTDSNSIMWNDSENKPQATYYGADTGVNGLNGYVKWYGGSNANGACNFRWYVPYAPCTYTKLGGHVGVNGCCHWMANHSGTRNQFSAGAGAPSYSGTYAPARWLPGSGAAGAANCASCQSCGAYPTGGKVAIYFS